VSRLLLFAFLIVFMAVWSTMLCVVDDECRPFESWSLIQEKESVGEGGVALSEESHISNSSVYVTSVFDAKSES